MKSIIIKRDQFVWGGYIVSTRKIINSTRKSREINILDEIECDNFVLNNVELTLKDTNLWSEMGQSNAVQLRVTPEQQIKNVSFGVLKKSNILLLLRKMCVSHLYK